tara:strand:+ start:199 stop:459 length:261 start_codon:yes stop_codon:yes gene_type:complete
MKIFIIKSLFIFVSIFILFKITIGSLIDTYEERFSYYFSKEHSTYMKDKIRKEMQSAITKDKYLDPEDAKLISQFIIKIRNELNSH